jgi:hypothetical protein
MNIEQARAHLIDTHIDAIRRGTRANGYMLQSGPGVGKSESVKQMCARLAKRLNTPVGLVIEMIANLTTPDIRGFMIPIKDDKGGVPRTVFSLPPWMPDVDNIWVFTPDGEVFSPGTWDGDVPEVGVVFFDEWGQADEDVRKAAAPVILDGNCGTHFLPQTWRVVGAKNRTSDRSGTNRELMHIINRHGLIEIEGDPGCLLRHLEDLPDDDRPHILTRAFIARQPDIVFPREVPDKPEPFCTARTLCKMDTDLRVMMTEEDIANDKLPMTLLAAEICQGWIGKHAQGQFFTHMRFANEIPSLDDIFQNPRSAKVPAGKDAQMVCSYMLADQVNEETAQAITRYVLRFEREMQRIAFDVMLGGHEDKDVEQTMAHIRRAKALMPLREVQQWLMDNKDLLRAARS